MILKRATYRCYRIETELDGLVRSSVGLQSSQGEDTPSKGSSFRKRIFSWPKRPSERGSTGTISQEIEKSSDLGDTIPSVSTFNDLC